MNKHEFLKKHNLTEVDYRNLQRFEEVRKSGLYNMYEYFVMMKENNLNGGEKMVDFIKKDDNYGDFLETLLNKYIEVIGNINENKEWLKNVERKD